MPRSGLGSTQTLKPRLGSQRCRFTYAVRTPEAFRRFGLDAEYMAPEGRMKGCERIIVHAGEVQLMVTAHAEQRAARISLIRTGEQKFKPRS